MSGFTLPTSRPVTQAYLAEFDDWDGDGVVDYPGGFYHSIGWNGHNGIDYGCFTGDPIEAVADGVVTFAGWSGDHWLLSGGGNAILVEHAAYSVQTEYLHLSAVNVSVGQAVKKGQVIARSGATGAATAAHLHLGMLPITGINVNNRMRGRIDPTPYLYGNLNPDYAGAAAIAPQSSTVTPLEGFLMALTDAEQRLVYDRLKKYVDSPISQVPAKVWNETVLRGGKNVSVKQELADAKTEVQALRAAVVALAKDPSLTADQITQAVKAGIADGTVTVDVQVNGAAA
jgi:hypothetical protein